MEKGLVSLTLDDGWKSAVEHAFPLLTKYDVPATFYIISKTLNDTEFPLYMNSGDLNLLASHGHEIGIHTRSHLHLPELPETEAWTEIVEGREDLRILGFDSDTFAYPFGEWTPRIVKLVREAGFLAARSIVDGFNNETTNPLLLRCKHVVEDTLESDIREWIDEAVRKNVWLILMFHQIEERRVLEEKKWIYGTTPHVLESTLNYIQKSRIEPLTVREGMERLIR